MITQHAKHRTAEGGGNNFAAVGHVFNHGVHRQRIGNGNQHSEGCRIVNAHGAGEQMQYLCSVTLDEKNHGIGAREHDADLTDDRELRINFGATTT